MPESQVENPKAVLDEWLGRLDALVHDVKGWAEASGWRTRVVRKTMRGDPALGRYEAPLLLMEREGAQVVLNPAARFVPGADGGVDLYLAPAYDDIATLYFENGRWVVHYALRPDPTETHSAIEPEALPFSEETVTQVLDKIAGNA